MFSTKHKVYTGEATAIDAAEDVNVEGKRYPTNKLGRAIVRHPCWMFLTVLLPIAFFVVGIIMIRDKISFELADFQLSNRVDVQIAQEKFDRMTSNWTAQLTGQQTMMNMVDRGYMNTIWKDDLEIRYVVSETYYAPYCEGAGFKNCDDSVADEINLLSSSRMSLIRLVENVFTVNSQVFFDVCFTNNLEFGDPTNFTPQCVPITSVAQYYYPEYDGHEWHLTAQGSDYQQEVVPRLLQNPNIRWYTDSAFSAANPVARKLRSLISLATSPGVSEADYIKKRKAYVNNLIPLVASVFKSYGMDAYLGGSGVENARIETEASKDAYKVAITFVIVFVLSWWHCGAFTMGLYTGAQVIFVYLATCGLYALITKSLPLMTYAAIIWVTTFAMHGTLSFYDMFVYTSVMATKGRQNNLTVAQRMCFTMRRTTAGVWIANILAIIIFAINTTSVFNSVYDFSIFMIIAFLWNMYFLLLPTPAFVAIHHFYFSNKRRSLQKQKDIINAAVETCRRDDSLVDVLSTVQQTLSTGEHLYTIDDDVMRQRIGANQGINKKRYKGTGNFLKQQVHIGLDKVRAARRDVTGAVHKLRKTKRQIFGGGDGDREDGPLPANLAAAQTTEFEMDRFATVGANPFGHNDDDDEGGPRYTNTRLVPVVDLLHVPRDFTERTEKGWRELSEAMGQVSSDGRLCPPKTVSLQGTSTHDTDELDAFAKRWEAVARRLDVPVSEGRTRPAVPLAVRAVVRAQDPTYVIGGRPLPEEGPTTSGHAEGNAEALQDGDVAASQDRKGRRDRIVDPGVSGFGLKKLRYRLQHRDADDRGCLCGLCGRKRNETPEERMERLMTRRVKQEGYTLFERFIIRAYVPFVNMLRFLLTALLIALAIAVIFAAAFTVKAGGVPVTLVDNDGGAAAAFKALDDSFGQRGTCTFCGGYYIPKQKMWYPDSYTIEQCLTQLPQNGMQMNGRLDQCGVCYGDDACLDCAGVPNGTKVADACGGCEEPGVTDCSCAHTRDCTYCEWALGASTASGGFQCATECTCAASNALSVCDQYRATCDVTYAKDTQCMNRGSWLEASQSPTGEGMCACNGHWRGPNCEFCDCENGGMCAGSSGQCSCPGAFTGPRCETCAASCVRNGVCPSTPPVTTWDIRTCVMNQCTEEEIHTGVFCAACDVNNLLDSGTCLALSTEAQCLASTSCFWREADSRCLYAKQSRETVDSNCKCTNTLVWSGTQCALCLAPLGGTCTSPTEVTSCDGEKSSDPSLVMSADMCGVCGGDGYCPGCDGIVGSGLVVDNCGVCGGDNKCNTSAVKTPSYLTINFLFDFSDMNETTVLSASFAVALQSACRRLIVQDTFGGNRNCVIVDYLTARSAPAIISIPDLYLYAQSASRVAELGFELNPASNEAIKLTFMTNRLLTNIDDGLPAESLYGVYQNVKSVILEPANRYLTPYQAVLTATSDIFQQSAAAALSLTSLWFATGIGLGVCFTFMITYYVSVITAIATTLVAIIVCFGSLTVCGIFSDDWTVDALLQVCISCTVPIGVEYVIHFTNGYFDYLQTTTSHLFARDVTRRTALQGAALRSLPSVCTSVVCVIFCSIMFDVSHLVPSKRTGQISITLHLLVLIAVFLYSGAMAALGPMKTFQHWTLSTAMCLVCGILAVIAVLIILGVGGVMGPSGERILGKESDV